jgi:hypothetical protein
MQKTSQILHTDASTHYAVPDSCFCKECMQTESKDFLFPARSVICREIKRFLFLQGVYADRSKDFLFLARSVICREIKRFLFLQGSMILVSSKECMQTDQKISCFLQGVYADRLINSLFLQAVYADRSKDFLFLQGEIKIHVYAHRWIGSWKSAGFLKILNTDASTHYGSDSCFCQKSMQTDQRYMSIVAANSQICTLMQAPTTQYTDASTLVSAIRHSIITYPADLCCRIDHHRRRACSAINIQEKPEPDDLENPLSRWTSW